MDLEDVKLDDTVKRQVAEAGITTGVWPVWAGRSPVALAVLTDGVAIFDGVGVRSYGWPSVAELRVERYAVFVRPEGEAEGMSWGLAERSHGPFIRDALATAGGPLSDPPAPPPSTVATDGATSTRVRSAADPASGAAGQARSLLTMALAAGVLTQLLGGVLVAAYDDPAADGSEAGVMVGTFLLWAGGIGVLVGVVGFGVLLGIRAAREE